MTEHVVVGLDLSLTSTGIAVIHLDDAVDTATIQSAGKKDATLSARDLRLGRIVDKIAVATPIGALVAIEGPSFGQARQGGQHDRAGLWWRVVATLLAAGHDVVEIPPACRCKYATGKGNAPKDAVLAAAVKRYPDVDITGNDVADAVIIAAMARRWLGHPIDTMPQAHLVALDKIAWPHNTVSALAVAP